MTIVQGTPVYSNVDRRLVTFDEPADHVLQITPGAFGAPMNGPQLNTFTFQFSGGGGGGPTMAIEVMGPTGAFSAYTNSGGDAATGITAGSAYIVDTGSWPQFRVTWTGSDASAVLSVLGWNSSATVPALQAELATAQADITGLQAQVATLTPQMAIIPVAVAANATKSFVGVPFDSGTVSAATFTAATAATSAAGAITLGLYRLDNDAEIVAQTNIKGSTAVTLTVGTGAFASGVYAKTISNNADAVTGLGMALHIEYTR